MACEQKLQFAGATKSNLKRGLLEMNIRKLEQMPKRLERTTICESEHVCLYTDRVRLISGDIIEKYHQIHLQVKKVKLRSKDVQMEFSL